MKSHYSCVITGCVEPASVHVQWGSERIRCEGDFCDNHKEELWQQLNPLVKCCLMWVSYSTPNGIQKNEEFCMSKRSELAQRLADFINENDLAQVFGGDVTQDEKRRGKPYVTLFSKRRSLDGVITVFGEKFIHVKYRTQYGHVPTDGSHVFESEDNAKEFLRLAFVEFDDKAMEVPMKNQE